MSRSLIAVIVLFPAPTIATAGPSAELADGKIVVTGLKSTDLKVVVAEGTEADIAARPAISGEWESKDGKLVFTPRYPFRPATRYRIVGASTQLEVRTPKPPPAERTAVTHVYPTATELPENVLRFYVAFNRPMPRGDVYRFVSLYTETGKKDVQPFVELDAELWNSDQTLLTLLIDPGRIKKEVKPRIDLGPVFRQGTKYTLVVSGKWPTLDGSTIGDDLRKSIAVIAPVAEGIDWKGWRLTVPVDHTSPLTVKFDRVMDHPILMRALSVVGPDGNPITGKAQTSNNDREWSFRPSDRWAPGAYKLRVDTILEDVSGNRLGRPFEIDLARPAPMEVKQPIDLPFTVGRR